MIKWTNRFIIEKDSLRMIIHSRVYQHRSISWIDQLSNHKWALGVN